ncbi:MAG: hypothetical protein IJP31_06525 [Lachnospiraceae bacterium]|nr:hypothetical protein [Lachnospiraceae bacterium]
MGRGFCQRKNYEKEFGAKLKGSIGSAGLMCKKVARALGIADGTLSRRFENPGKMTLLELKAFIKLTGLKKEEILNYLYEGDEH